MKVQPFDIATAIPWPGDSSSEDEGNNLTPANGCKEASHSSRQNSIVQDSSYTSSLWADAVEEIREQLPSEIQEQLPNDLKESAASQILSTVINEAQKRQEDLAAREHQIELPSKSS